MLTLQPAVVGGEDDRRVVVLPGRFQLRDDLRYVVVNR